MPSKANTADGKLHIIYPITGGVAERNYNGSSWSSETTIGDGYTSPSLSAVSNDLWWNSSNFLGRP